jgi:type II secretory pathway pseudopilin PulG
MSSMSRAGRASAGFSLIEALVALAIAAALTAVLTRLIITTRAGAARVGELTEMAALGDTLMARVASSQGLRPGRTAGRRGAFVWHVDIAPVPFTALARRISEKRASAPVVAEQAGAPAKLATAFTGGDAHPPTPPQVKWAAYRVAVVVQASTGRTYAVDTIRIGPPPENGDR